MCVCVRECVRARACVCVSRAITTGGSEKMFIKDYLFWKNTNSMAQWLSYFSQGWYDLNSHLEDCHCKMS